MAELAFKPGVVVLRYTRALDWMLRCLLELARREPWASLGVTVTSVQDGTHPAGPAHADGRAVDVRSKHLPDLRTKGQFRDELEVELNGHLLEPDRFMVLLEKPGQAEEHFHVQVRRSRTFLGT